MARSQRRRNSKRTVTLLKSSGSSSPLHELMRELAFVLLTQGITPKSFGELSRSAFVEAAAARSRLLNGRVNQSRVAVQTGLSRADVKRLLSRKGGDVHAAPQLTAIQRVTRGWRSDRRFLDVNGTPKAIPICGRQPSFIALSKKYAGDVPYRAVLGELERISAVKVTGGQVRLSKTTGLGRGARLSALAAVMPALLDGLRIASATDHDPAKSVHRLQIPAKSELELAFLRDRCVSSAKSMLEGLGHSLGVSAQSARSKRREGIAFSVCILLTENRSRGDVVEGLKSRRKP